MKVFFHKNFKKDLQKLNKRDKEKANQRIQLFMQNPFDEALHNHSLKGKYADYRSIDITRDLRAIFKLLNIEECIFVAVNTHSNLYS